MSLWTRLFGRSEPKEAGPVKPTATEDHKGYTIRAEPYRAEGGQFQTAGTVCREIDGVVKEHRFIRADRFASVDDATAFALVKGRQLVDEQGERMFRTG